MVAPGSRRRLLLGRDVAVAYGVVVALYLAKGVGAQPLQIPAYLLIVAYDVVEVAFPVLTPYHPVGFPLFLYLLAVIGAGVARRLRTEEMDAPTFARAAGGVCLVVASLALAFAGFVGGPLVSPVDNPTPLAIAATTGAVFLLVGWGLLGRPVPSVSSADDEG